VHTAVYTGYAESLLALYLRATSSETFRIRWIQLEIQSWMYVGLRAEYPLFFDILFTFSFLDTFLQKKNPLDIDFRESCQLGSW